MFLCGGMADELQKHLALSGLDVGTSSIVFIVIDCLVFSASTGTFHVPWGAQSKVPYLLKKWRMWRESFTVWAATRSHWVTQLESAILVIFLIDQFV